jgi:hypothetical protein
MSVGLLLRFTGTPFAQTVRVWKTCRARVAGLSRLVTGRVHDPTGKLHPNYHRQPCTRALRWRDRFSTGFNASIYRFALATGAKR